MNGEQKFVLKYFFNRNNDISILKSIPFVTMTAKENTRFANKSQ